MKTNPATLQFSVLLAAAVMLGSYSFCRPAGAQPLPVGAVNPTTGRPAGPGKPGRIDPATGLQVPAPPAPSALRHTGSASAPATEPWSLEVVPGSQPDLGTILAEARQQTSSGQYEEALQRYLWLHNHAQEFGDATQRAMHLSSAPAGWEELGRRYPKAKRALMEIRDSATKELAEGRGYLDLFRDVQAINRELQTEDATYALFKLIREKDPKLAGQCYFAVEDLLVSKGEYQWCLSQIGEPQRRFDLFQQWFDMYRTNQKRTAELRQRDSQHMAALLQQRGLTNSWAPPETSAILKHAGEDRFVGQTRQLIEILVGTGHTADAERLRTHALAMLEDPRLNSALKDAKERIQKRSLRTGIE